MVPDCGGKVEDVLQRAAVENRAVLLFELGGNSSIHVMNVRCSFVSRIVEGVHLFGAEAGE